MKSPFLILHQAQRDRIVAETGYKVYDEFPGLDVAMPYVIMGEVSGRDWSDKFAAGQEVTSTLHIIEFVIALSRSGFYRRLQRARFVRDHHRPGRREPPWRAENKISRGRSINMEV
jgi:hypothetical protein